MPMYPRALPSFAPGPVRQARTIAPRSTVLPGTAIHRPSGIEGVAFSRTPRDAPANSAAVAAAQAMTAIRTVLIAGLAPG